MCLRLHALLFAQFAGLAGAATAGTPIPNDPDFALQWALRNAGQVVNGQAGTPGADVGAPDAWTTHDGAANVIVAIVGTGVDPHAEFADRLLEGYVAPTAGGDLYSTLDSHNHGTRVAGIIAARRDDGVGIAGLNDRAWVLPVRVLDGSVGTEASTAQGIVWAVDFGAHVVVVPLQFYEGTQALADAVAYAAAHDVVLIAPAGHEGEDSVAFPAAFAGCLAVSSTDSSDARAGFSNTGPQIQLSAPSRDIWSTQSGGGYGFEETDSSAWAAAHVAGVASLIRSYAPHLSAAQVRQILIDSTDDLGAPGWDPVFGAGRLNADRALRNAPPPALRFEFDTPLPSTIDPGAATELTIRIANVGEQAVAPLARLFHRVPPADFTATPLQRLFDDTYRAVLPGTACGSTLEYFFRAAGDEGGVVVDPPEAPAVWHSATAIRVIHVFEDDFETDAGWTTAFEGGPTTTGGWTRTVPVGTTAQPAYDFSPDFGQQCFITGQHFGGLAGTNDVDGGPVRLLSPVVSLTSADAEVSYARWFHTEQGTPDSLTVELSRDGGTTWALIESAGETSPWATHVFLLSDFPNVTGDRLLLRFTTSDMPPDSLTEAAIDEVRVRGLSCSAVRGDADGDGDVDASDFARSTLCWNGPGIRDPASSCSVFDFDLDGDVDLADFRVLQNRFEG